jgi:hypothetical protein|tara:strand:- start:624 stop:803 length:180 start_codon:yes stop_codon:yes gene_type:complete
MFDFPDNPSDGDTVTHPNGLAYQWSSTSGVWFVVQDDLAALTARVVALESVLQNSLLLE